MEITIGVISAIVAAAVGFISAAVTAFFQRRDKQRVKKLQEYFSKRYMTLFTTNYDKMLDKYVKELQPDSRAAFDDYRDYFLRDFRNILAHYPVPSEKKEIEAEVNSRIEEMNRRIETIEVRLPKEATLDKLESVNDAILATQIEALTESVKDLKGKMITKWDVAKVVFTILGALGVIIGMIIGILTVMQQ